jgi:glycerol-3-phosphate dehydrogenase
LRPEDVALVHCGLVPGRRGASGLWTRSRLVDHEAEDGVPGLFSALAVKYTTGRALAQQAVDRVVARLGVRVAPCRTAVTPLPAARELEGTLEERTRHAVREEMARTLADVALRRLDLGTGGPPAPAELETVARTLAAERGFSAERLARERGELDAVYRNGIAAIFEGRDPA